MGDVQEWPSWDPLGFPDTYGQNSGGRQAEEDSRIDRCSDTKWQGRQEAGEIPRAEKSVREDVEGENNRGPSGNQSAWCFVLPS